MFKRDENQNYYFIEEFRELGIEALYTGVGFPYEEFEKERNIVHGKQTHSKNIQVIREEDLDNFPYPDCDGLVTDKKGLVLYTKHADCLAIYFYDRKREIIGLCHSGWKGSYEKIALEVVEKMRIEYGSELEDILIGIGIGIALENYEVSKEFYENFKGRYSDKVLDGVFLKRDGNGFADVEKKEENFCENIRIYFDNERFNYNLLVDYGIPKENIILSELCTFNDKTLHSHRRDREKAGRNRAYLSWNTQNK